MMNKLNVEDLAKEYMQKHYELNTIKLKIKNKLRRLLKKHPNMIIFGGEAWRININVLNVPDMIVLLRGIEEKLDGRK